MAKKSESELTYKSTITNMSSNITRFQAVMMTGSHDNLSIGDIVEKGRALYFRPVGWLTQHIVNSKSDDGEYDQLLILADDGTVYSTGSTSFMESFYSLMDSIDDMEESEIPADWQIKATARDSKNYKGKQFLTCSIVIGAHIEDSVSDDGSMSESNGDGFTNAPAGIEEVMQ